MYCANCQSELKDGVKNCNNCGAPANTEMVSNDTKSAAIQPEIKQGEFPEHQVINQQTQFKVEQKLLSLSPNYKIKDMSDNELMIAKARMLTFLPEFIITRPDGTHIGQIQSNFLRTRWTLFDNNRTELGTIVFPFLRIFNKKFTIETTMGVFNSGTSFFANKFEVFTPQGESAYVVDKQIMKIRDTFNIVSNGILSPFMTCMSAVIIDMKFHQEK